jgi:hypothetical protein
VNPQYAQRKAARQKELRTRNGRPFNPWALHGTPGGYTNDLCRCFDCTDAWAEYCRNYQQERRRRAQQPAHP